MFPKRLFQVAGIYGLIVIVPQYFMESRVGIDFPPPITHPEHYYGFLGVTLACQILFLMISRDPARYRLLMLPSILGKFSFAIAVLILLAQSRVPTILLPFASIDILLGVLFAVAYAVTPRE
jgi:hypothetical protein